MVDTIYIMLMGNYCNMLKHKNGKNLGEHQNLKVIVRPEYLYIKGSLCTYLKGNNYERLDFNEISVAISEIEKELGISLRNGIITRLDLGETIRFNSPIAHYFDFLTDFPRLDRSITGGSTLYFKNTSRQIKLYDKKKQLRIPNHSYRPELRDGITWMRVETTYFEGHLKHLCGILGIRHLTISKLLDIKIYKFLITRWNCDIMTITQTPKLLINPIALETPREIIDMYALIGIQQSGGAAEALERIKLLKAHSNIKREYFTRMRNAIKKITSNQKLISSNQSLIDEFNNQIKGVFDYHIAH